MNGKSSQVATLPKISTSNPDVLVSGEVNISVDQALSRTNKR